MFTNNPDHESSRTERPRPETTMNITKSRKDHAPKLLLAFFVEAGLPSGTGRRTTAATTPQTRRKERHHRMDEQPAEQRSHRTNW